MKEKAEQRRKSTHNQDSKVAYNSLQSSELIPADYSEYSQYTERKKVKNLIRKKTTPAGGGCSDCKCIIF